jgi:hypothetical protein
MDTSIILFIVIVLLFLYYLNNNNNELFISPETVYTYDENKPMATMNYNYSKGLYNSFLTTSLYSNNINFSFIISTAINKSLLSEHVKRKINTKELTISFKSYNCSSKSKDSISFNIDNTKYEKLPIYAEGLIGTDILSKYVIRFFNNLNQIGLYNPDKYILDETNFNKFNIKIIDNIVLIAIDIIDIEDNIINEWFILDIGYPKSFITKKYQVKSKNKNLYVNPRIHLDDNIRYVNVVDNTILFDDIAAGIIGIDFLNNFNNIIINMPKKYSGYYN